MKLIRLLPLLAVLISQHAFADRHYQTVEGQANPVVAVNFRMVREQELVDVPRRFFDGDAMN